MTRRIADDTHMMPRASRSTQKVKGHTDPGGRLTGVRTATPLISEHVSTMTQPAATLNIRKTVIKLLTYFSSVTSPPDENMSQMKKEMTLQTT